jgi:cell division protein FtsW (lipid II flippase)
LFDFAHLPCWFQEARLFLVFLLTAGFGINAYYQHKQEAVEAVSPRKWMYWTYALVFLMVSSVTFLQLCITVAFKSYSRASFHIGYSTFLVIISYFTLMAGTKRKITIGWQKANKKRRGSPPFSVAN